MPTQTPTDGLERDYDNLPAGYDRDGQARTGAHERWIGPTFGDHERLPQARHPRGLPPKGYQRSDERIYEEVNERLGASSQLDPRDVEVKVERAEVTLMGRVRTRREKKIAEWIASGVEGVDDVHNVIRVVDPALAKREGPIT